MNTCIKKPLEYELQDLKLVKSEYNFATYFFGGKFKAKHKNEEEKYFSVQLCTEIDMRLFIKALRTIADNLEEQIY